MVRGSSRVSGALGLAGLAASLAGCTGSGSSSAQPPASMRVQKTFLVSDVANVAAVTDPNLVNPWGIALSSASPFWVSDNGSGKATLYNGTGAPQALVVNVATPSAQTGGTPTGQVFNGTTDFNLGDGKPAVFVFSTEDGTIAAWSRFTGTTAVVTADRSAFPSEGSGAVYKGLALGSNPSGNFLFATNFRTGTVDVFDTNFGLVLLPGSFVDPNLPPGFAPFGIQNIGGDLYVTYARQDAAMHDDVGGAGSGLIDVFDSNGNFKRRFATGTLAGGSLGALNSPWGMAVAPSNFGAFSGALLVGNFGDGRISAFSLSSGAFIGQLRDSATNSPVAIPGLWGLAFGNGASAGPASTLFFTAGIGDPPTFVTHKESHGLFGSLQIAP